MKALGGFDGNGAAHSAEGDGGEKPQTNARQGDRGAPQGGADERQGEQTGDEGARANMLAAIIERHERISNSIKRRR